MKVVKVPHIFDGNRKMVIMIVENIHYKTRKMFFERVSFIFTHLPSNEITMYHNKEVIQQNNHFYH